MSSHQRFRFKDKEALLKKIKELGVDIPFTDDIEILFEGMKIDGKTVPNRFVVQPMEGFDSNPDGTPGELTFRRYKRHAAGGSGIIWFEATAVVHQGRSNPRQLYITNNNVEVFEKLVKETRSAANRSFGNSHNPVLILQLTHSGRYSKPSGKPQPIIAHHSDILDPLCKLPRDFPLIADNELDALQEAYACAAQLAAKAGFDGVDIKACHGYLVSELLASFTRKDSKYGGSFENRIRFLLETAKKIKENVTEIFVTSRLNAYDAIPYPFSFGVNKTDCTKEDISETKTLIKEFIKIDFPILNLSIGNPYYLPHYGRPYDFATAGMQVAEEHPLVGVARLIRITSEIQRQFPGLPIVGTGYAWLRHFFPNVAAAIVKSGKAALIGQGRGAFAYPDSVKDLAEKGTMDPYKVCVTCSGCSQIMRDGGRTGCVIRDKEIYGAEYRKARTRADDVLKNEAVRCRECDSAMCQLACPAGIDVPGFIKAFNEGDINKAYSILAEKNVLPEMCALICPVEDQCQGACLENIISGVPIAISKIQYAIARQARESGITSIIVHEKSSDKKIAVVGAGPAGIACATKLLQLGYYVEIFEKTTTLGGMPSSVIPMQKIDSEIPSLETNGLFKDAIQKKRLAIHMNFPLNEKNNLESIRKKFAAVFLGFGLSKSMYLPGATVRPLGVEGALSFLKRIKSKHDHSVGNKVAILGGGNTAFDAAVVAKDSGAKDVYIVYRRSFQEMPVWPNYLHVALEKGIHFLLFCQPIDYVEKNEKLVGLKMARTELGELDNDSRRKSITIPDSEFVMTVDHVIEAFGQRIDDETIKALGAVEFDHKGWIKINDQFRTSFADVFAGGDIIHGGTTAVQAIAEGMKAAAAIHELI